MICIITPILIILILALVFWVTLLIAVSRFNPPEGILAENKNVPKIDPENTISILSWNLGYAGLGEESNFLADGGKSILPPSRQIVQKNIENITKFLEQNNADIYILQEVAKKSRLIFNLDLWEHIESVLTTKFKVHSPTVKIPWLPIIGRLETGNAILSNLPYQKVFRHNLPLEEKGFTGILQQKYNFILSRYKLENSEQEFVLINLHLAAFDEGGIVRKKQLAKLKKVMRDEYKKGNFVVVGGDWNHRLVDTNFPYSADDKFQFWIHDLPADFTPESWKWALDESVPTVRTLEKPYKPNDNYTCIIDGFLLSPNIKLESVKTFDLQFKYTDHHPQKIEILLKGSNHE
ncbi:MAG: endonuclease/exonuclease/phosphatase family protein [Candidatus Cloacimonetes bacterium]|nr:endonuclease/exonuclease/phosphatase family protein [Candidatus Cloacimonadota bacterium]